MNNIEAVVLEFENCEVHTYKGKFIEEILLNESQKVIDEYFEQAYSTKEFYLKLKPEANKNEYVDINFQDWTKVPFKRIVERDDIVYIMIEYKDGLVEKHQLDWDEEGYWQTNDYQKSLIDTDGSLNIAVHKRNKDL